MPEKKKKTFTSRDARNCIIVPSDLDHKYSRGVLGVITGDVLAGIIGALVATNYIEILNNPNRLAEVAATGAYIHNQAALLASDGVPISATKVIDEIPSAIKKILK